jgi:hypothetical protein
MFFIRVNRILESCYLDYTPACFAPPPYLSVEAANLEHVFYVDSNSPFYLLLVWTVHFVCVLGVRFLVVPVMVLLVYLEPGDYLYGSVLSTCYRELVVYSLYQW